MVTNTFIYRGTPNRKKKKKKKETGNRISQNIPRLKFIEDVEFLHKLESSNSKNNQLNLRVYNYISCLQASKAIIKIFKERKQ